MDVSITPTSWHGISALALENEILRTVVVPQMGAKLVSLFDKRQEVEWLVGPAERPFRPPPYGATFTEQDMSGWDEMFPTISACDYPAPGPHKGTPLPDHGEVWALPWVVKASGPHQLLLAVEGKAVPYTFSRALRFSAPDTLQLHYQLLNKSRQPMPYIWAAHPQFDCGQSAEIRLPQRVERVYNTLPEEWGWGPPETECDWPVAVDKRGRAVRLDEVGPAALQKARKFFVLPQVQIDWVALIRKQSQDWLRMAWSPSEVPYFGLWIDEGALSHASVTTPEPTTGFYDSLAIAWQKEEVTVAEPGESCTWTLTVQVGSGKEPLAVRD